MISASLYCSKNLLKVGAAHKSLKIGFGCSANAAVMCESLRMGGSRVGVAVYITSVALFVVVYEKHCGRPAVFLWVAGIVRQSLYGRFGIMVSCNNENGFGCCLCNRPRLR